MSANRRKNQKKPVTIPARRNIRQAALDGARRQSHATTTEGQRQPVPALGSSNKNNARKKLNQMLSGTSFVLSSQVQQAPFSNSNKQVHLNLVHVSRSITRKHSEDKMAGSPLKRALKRNNNFVSCGDNDASDHPTNNDFLKLSKLRDQQARLSATINTSSASTCHSAASHGLSIPRSGHRDDDGENESFTYNIIKLHKVPVVSHSHMRFRTETQLETKVRLRTSEPGQRLKQLFLNKQKAKNRYVNEVLDNCEVVRKKSQATINRADNVNQRARGLIGASNQIDRQLSLLRNLLTKPTRCEDEPSIFAD